MALEFTTLVKPANEQVVDPETGQMRPEWSIYFTGLTARLNGAADILSTDPAPAAAEYIVSTANASLTAERVATDTTTVDVDMGTAGQAKWNVLEVPGIAATGLVARTAAATYAARTLTGPAAGIGVTNGNGVSGNPTLALANDLAALEGLGSTGIAVRSTTDTWVQRSIAVGASTGVSVSNGDGVAGNPTISGVTATESDLGVADLATDSEIRSAAIGAHALQAADLETAAAYVALTETAGAVAVDWDTFSNGEVTVDQNTVISNPTNGQPGTFRQIYVLGNDATDRTITFGNQFLGELPTITNADSGRAYLLTIHCKTASHFVVSSKRALG